MMETKRHGSPEFYKLLDEMADTHDRKSHDYASDDNPFGNYHFAGSVARMFSDSRDAGFAGRLAEKIYRLANLTGRNPLNESIIDTEIDILVITALWMTDRRERRNYDLPDSRERKRSMGVGEGPTLK